MESSKKVGIRRVAELAKVSPATVSQVYNNKGEVAAATRERVLEVGSRLGYRPNAIGQALQSGRSRVIGVVVSYRDSAVWEQTYMPYYRNIIAGAAIEAVEHGYSISAAPGTADGRIETYVPLDGVIVVDPVPNDPIVEQSIANGLAVVTDGWYETANPSARLMTVRTDLAHGIPALLDHLAAGVAPGSLRPGLFIGPRIDSYTGDTLRMYRLWCENNDCEPIVQTLIPGQAPTDAARELLSAGSLAKGSAGMNAVHCLNETYCIAVLAAAAELDIAVPEALQVSVAGNAFAVGSAERATYLNIDPVNTGALCAKTLIALLEGQPSGDLLEKVTVVPARYGSLR